MSLLFIVSLLIQAGFIIHVIKTGRNQLWIWVLIIPGLAFAGILAYIVVEILPELLRSRTARRTAHGLRKAMDPGADLRRYESEARVAGNVSSRHLLYARALEAEGNVPKALEEYRVLATSYPGAEAAVRYAQLLQSHGERAEAQKVARELLEQARIAPGHYRRAQRTWLEAAQRLLQG